MQRAGHIDKGGNAVFSGHNRPMRELPANFEDETTDERENRCPARIGALGDEYISRCELTGLTQIPDKTGYALLLDPLSAAVCSPAEINALFDDRDAAL